MTVAISAIVSLMVIGAIASIIVADQFRRQKNDARYARYVSEIQTASFHLQNNSTAVAQRILRNVPPEHRGWEWVFLANQAWRESEPSPDTDHSEIGELSATDFWKDGKLYKYPEIVANSGGIPSGRFTFRGDQVVLTSQENALSFYDVASARLDYSLVNPMRRAIVQIHLTASVYGRRDGLGFEGAPRARTTQC